MDKDFHNIGIGILRHNVVAEACKAEQELNSGNTIDVDRAAIKSDMSVLGRFLVTKKDSDIASFKTPNLRNVLITAPYFHDGSQATLWDVLDHYNKGDGIKDPWLDEDMQPLGLSESEIDDVVASLASLTSAQYMEQGMKELERQRSLSRTSRPQRDTARAFGPKPVQPKRTVIVEHANRRKTEIMLTSFPRRWVRDGKMLDLRSTSGRHKHGSVFFPHWWEVPRGATCHAADRARLSISGAVIAGGRVSTWEDQHLGESLESSGELGVGVVAYRPCQSINF